MRAITIEELEADPVRAIYDVVRYGPAYLICDGQPRLLLEPLIGPGELPATLDEWRSNSGAADA